MSINNGQPVDAPNSNAAFVSKTTNSDIIAIPSLKNNDVGSGSHVDNPQKAINKAFDTLGISGESDANAKVYSSHNAIADGDSHKAAIQKLDAAISNVSSDFVQQVSNLSEESSIVEIIKNNLSTTPYVFSSFEALFELDAVNNTITKLT